MSSDTMLGAVLAAWREITEPPTGARAFREWRGRFVRLRVSVRWVVYQEVADQFTAASRQFGHMLAVGL